MKKITIISIVVAPLLAGCASASLNPGPSAEVSRSQARTLSGIRSQLHKLRRRVGALNRKVAAQSNAATPAVTHEAAAFKEMASRVADLEAALRLRAPNGTDSNAVRDVSDLAEQHARLAQKVEQLALRETSGPLANSGVDQKQIDDRLTKLEVRLTQLRSVKPSGDSAADIKPLMQRLSKLEVAQKSSTGKFNEMSGELEKDRVLVIDFLEDLDKRISELEDASSAKPAPGKKP